MVGYSALAQANETLALQLLDEHRHILRPIFAKFDGREIETAGDSFFVEFNSAVEAVNCAIEIQTTLHTRNQAIDGSKRILLRIGLHIGDVVYMGDHVHGDGVNIAARLEPLATPGGICVSEDVARQVRNKISYPVQKAGIEKLKNISIPMEVYCIVLPWLKEASPRNKRVSAKKRTYFALAGVVLIAIVTAALFFMNPRNLKASSNVRHRLAVLPLKNISNDARDDFFADGMTEELISNIARIGGLNVIARTSTMKYKETTKDIRQIGEELNVGTVLEGSVRRSDNKARITVQLVDVARQVNLWSQDYDRELSDIFSIQSEISASIARELKVRLVESELSQGGHSTTRNMDAYQEYLTGKHFLNQRTSEGIKTAVAHFEASITHDPDFTLPYPALAYCYTLLGAAGYGDVSRTDSDHKSRKALQKALQLDPNLAEAYAASAYAKFRIDWDWDGAENDFKKAIALKPGYATAHEWYALYLAVRGRLDEALKHMQSAYELDPLSSSVNTGLARIYHFRQELRQAADQIHATIKLDPSYAEAHFTEGMVYHRMKNYTAAEKALQKAIELSGRRPVTLGMMGANYAAMGKMSEVKAILTELQQPPMNNDKLYASGIIHLAMGEHDQVFPTFEKLTKQKYGLLIYMKVQNDFFNLPKHPRYAQLMKEIGL